jgi:hypothetical protein
MDFLSNFFLTKNQNNDWEHLVVYFFQMERCIPRWISKFLRSQRRILFHNISYSKIHRLFQWSIDLNFITLIQMKILICDDDLGVAWAALFCLIVDEIRKKSHSDCWFAVFRLFRYSTDRLTISTIECSLFWLFQVSIIHSTFLMTSMKRRSVSSFNYLSRCISTPSQ